jgi:hypothetical protein
MYEGIGGHEAGRWFCRTVWKPVVRGALARFEKMFDRRWILFCHHAFAGFRPGGGAAGR